VPIQTVFLDAGGILVHPNWSRVSETLERHGVPVTAEALSAAEPRAKQRLDCDETIQATNDEQRGWTYFDLVLTEAGVPLTASTAAALLELNAYHQRFNLWETVLDDVLPTLAALRARGLQLVVVSNANGTLLSVLTRLGLAEALDVIFDSHVVGIEKPDPRFFRLALERSGARAETTVHVGDLYHVDVVGARSAGVAAILLDAGGLYADYDCPRVRTIGEVVDLIANDGWK
jgi:HAD superfamily hydrolase (TIGR01509 family)